MIGVEFTVPTGYRLTNLPDRVVVAHRQGPTVILIKPAAMGSI